MNYYNEIDPYAAQWLRNLIAAGLIPPGYVDERSILDVKPVDLKPYVQCHFFAGIAGWSRALQIAAWPVDRPVWTGSCPCQPFSAAGQSRGFADERHLWPYWFHLIEQCRPQQIFGEQVASKSGLAWFDLVRSDLEAAGYAVAGADLCAASVGAPHIRQRLWFVADADAGGQRNSRSSDEERSHQPHAAERGGYGGLGQPASVGRTWGRPQSTHGEPRQAGQDVLEHAAGEQMGLPGQPWALGDAMSERRSGRRGHPARHGEAEQQFEHAGSDAWRNADWLPCTDGKARPVESLAQQMVDGLSAGMGYLRADKQLKKEVADAANCYGFEDEVLSALRRGHVPAEIWQSLGRRLGFSKTTLLLVALCEQSRELGAVFYSLSSRGAEIGEAYLREMPHATLASARSSQGWRLSEQCAQQLADALSKLPQAHPLESFNGFPLATNIPGRVGRLRAYGNAIVPQVAAEFIKAYLFATGA